VHEPAADAEERQPAPGRVVTEGGVDEGHRRPGSLIVEGTAVASDTRTPARLVAGEDGVGDGRRRGVRRSHQEPGIVLDGTADPVVPIAGAERLVVDEGAV